MSVYDEYEPPASTGSYLKFEDSVPYVLRVMSEPVVYTSTFRGNSRTMYAWLVWNFKSESVQVLQLPITAYRIMSTIARENGDPKEYNIRITRSGEAFNTKYNIDASKNKQPISEVAPTAEKEAEDVSLIERIEKGNGNSDIQWLADAVKAQGKNDSSEEDVPFNDKPTDVSDDDEW